MLLFSVGGGCGVGGGAGAVCLRCDVVGFTRHPWPLLVKSIFLGMYQLKCMYS